MAVFWASVVGLTVWITGWAFGIKALDTFMITIAVVVAAAAYEMVKP